MSSIQGFISDAAGLVIACLYSVAGQAHFTNRLTPGLAADVEVMTRNSYAALPLISKLQYAEAKQLLGALDLIAAACLWHKSTRRTGLILAVIGFSGGLYGQLATKQDITQVAGLLALAIVGLMCAPRGRA